MKIKRLKSFFRRVVLNGPVPKPRTALKETPFHLKFPSPLPTEIVNSRICVSHKHRFIYFRVPKAANSFILAQLLLNGEGERLSFAEVDKVKENYSISDQISHSELDILSQEYFKFAITRNPYSRFLSAYLDKIVRRKKQLLKVLARLDLPMGTILTLDQFASYLETDGALHDDAHWARQNDLIVMPNESLDFVGKFEKLNTDLYHIMSRIFGTFNVENLAQAHVTNADKTIETLINSDIRKRVFRLYYEDFERFEYPK